MITCYVANSPRVDPLSSWIVKKKRGSEVKKFLQISWNSLSKKLMGSRSSLHEHFVRVKTLMGLEPFEVRFLFWKKSTKMYLAINGVIENHSRFVYRLSMMFPRIWQSNFWFVKTLMGKPLDWKFFTLK